MKWIGQHIYDKLSRFRNDVYLEDISSGTIASGGNLGLDSNNKIVKATVSSGSGDITGVDLTGQAPITISSETGTTSGNYSATIEVNAANVSSRGVVELATTAETTTGTDVARAVTPNGLKDGYQGSSNVTTLGTIGTGEWRGTAINGTYIADDTINSQHYADESIDAAHIANNAVTFAKAQGVTSNVFGNVIKVLPSDFVTNDDGGVTKFGIGYVDAGGSTYGMKPTNANTELFAFVSIPEGMTATHVDIHAKQNRDIEVFEVQINANTMVSKGTGTSNTTLDITDVAATSTNLLALKITTTATGDRVFGAAVTIA